MGFHTKQTGGAIYKSINMYNCKPAGGEGNGSFVQNRFIDTRLVLTKCVNGPIRIEARREGHVPCFNTVSHGNFCIALSKTGPENIT